MSLSLPPSCPARSERLHARRVDDKQFTVDPLALCLHAEILAVRARMPNESNEWTGRVCNSYTGEG